MKIKEIIQSQIIETQEELASALQKEGIAVTQATVSRDIKEMMLVKIPYEDGRYRYALPTEKSNMISRNHTALLFQGAITKIDSSLNFIVIHTLPGSAQAVASVIDQEKSDDIMGTLAGDDTILVIAKTPEGVESFKKHIEELLQA